MIISKVRIENYRGIKNGEFFPSPMTCIIGENNAGKSTILIALSLFFSGRTLSKSDYYDSEKEIFIELQFKDISDSDLLRLPEESRSRINGIIYDEKLTLLRRYDIEGKSKIFCKKLLPIDSRLSIEDIKKLLKGKKSAEISDSLKELLPEKSDQFENLKSQKAAIEKIEEIISNLPIDQLKMDRSDLPTGIDNSIINFLPEPIYIAAVKDLTDDVKTKESTTFGRLLGILLSFLENTKEFEEISNSFKKLHSLLNITETKGVIEDQRIPQIIRIEEQLEGYLQENFPKIEIEIQIPKPDLKQIFSNSQIFINDGVKDTIETKGDGIKRSLTFALLRTYVYQLKEQKKQKLIEKNKDNSYTLTGQPYIFLFEEPELYLHPNAQKILFDALNSLSEENNQVFVTTHSPLFFSADTTGTFIKIIKEYPVSQKPYGKLLTINLSKDFVYKDAFLILCYENNTPAFFANKVLLVEGNSDLIYLKALAMKMNPNWNFDNHNIPIITMNGKTNIKKFTDFYEKFETKVYSLVDLDMLIDGFEKYGCSSEICAKRIELLNAIDNFSKKSELKSNFKAEKIKKLMTKYTWVEKYERLKELACKVMRNEKISQDEKLDIEYLFIEETNCLRRQILTQFNDDLDIKYDLLNTLRENNLFVLSSGSIESYYPPGVVGNDKPTKALDAVEKLNLIDDFNMFLPKIKKQGEMICEMELIFKKIFD